LLLQHYLFGGLALPSKKVEKQSMRVRSNEREKIKQFKTLFPFIAGLAVYFLALNSPMQKQINQNHSVENEIKPTLYRMEK